MIARNVKAERVRRGLTQEQLAARMSELGYRWHQQTAGQVEHCTRRLTAEEVLGLAVALAVPVDRLLYPPEGAPGVVLPGGRAVMILRNLPPARLPAGPPARFARLGPDTGAYHD
jgi:transcriptional regulator with XRE-family HTH domain